MAPVGAPVGAPEFEFFSVIMDIFKFISDLSSIQTCCIDTSCQYSSVNFSFQHGDFNSVSIHTFLDKDDFVTPCRNCSFLPSTDYISDLCQSSYHSYYK